jgi:hypothetical protein
MILIVSFSGIMILLWDQFVPFALVVGLVVVLLKLLIRTKSSRGNTPPCIPWIPVLGSLPFMPKLETFGLQFMEESKKRGKVFAFYASDRFVLCETRCII